MLLVRPTIGWLGYFVIRQSPQRLGLVLGICSLATLIILWESQHTLNLTYDSPGPYPPPVIIISPPDGGHMTAWDACGIEAATRNVEVKTKEKTTSVKKPQLADHEELQKLLENLRNPMTIDEAKLLKRDDDREGTDEGRREEDTLSRLHLALDEHDLMAQKIHDKFAFQSPDLVSEKLLDEPEDEQLRQQQNEEKKEEKGEHMDEQKDKEEKGEHMNEERDKQMNNNQETNKDDLKPGEVKLVWDAKRSAVRQVWVYRWTSTVFRGDSWTHFVNKLPGVHLNYFDAKRATLRTQLRSWRYGAGLSTWTSWVSWITASLSLLWSSGGIVIPMGVILTQPLTLSIMNKGEGILMGEAGIRGDTPPAWSLPHMGGVSPLVFGVPPRHPIVSEAMKLMLENDTLMSAQPADTSPSSPHSFLTPVTPLLTGAVKGACGSGVGGPCELFTLLPPDAAVAVDVMQLDEPHALGTLLHYASPPEFLHNPSLVLDLFRGLRLHRFCPRVSDEVYTRPLRDL
ncbi:uncharacterized protein LOC108673609 [Hyalella azteca]|uniref:Uncharacterized protein LOC108673609 n=1 Tax=Hyalella azteca TaxID=294128 RepID=A0A8B7NT72_HYAAZ|nr:uncharacterized protein LOC108673609 [Hyalella azteca]XP_018016949.1 uncharacterized protein LOC108673609 [Hyalella azteca]